jgi:hypothetical protein
VFAGSGSAPHSRLSEGTSSHSLDTDISYKSKKTLTPPPPAAPSGFCSPHALALYLAAADEAVRWHRAVERLTEDHFRARGLLTLTAEDDRRFCSAAYSAEELPWYHPLSDLPRPDGEALPAVPAAPAAGAELEDHRARVAEALEHFLLRSGAVFYELPVKAGSVAWGTVEEAEPGADRDDRDDDHEAGWSHCSGDITGLLDPAGPAPLRAADVEVSDPAVRLQGGRFAVRPQALAAAVGVELNGNVHPYHPSPAKDKTGGPSPAASPSGASPVPRFPLTPSRAGATLGAPASGVVVAVQAPWTVAPALLLDRPQSQHWAAPAAAAAASGADAKDTQTMEPYMARQSVEWRLVYSSQFRRRKGGWRAEEDTKQQG